MVEPVLVRRDNAKAWAVMPFVLGRLALFCSTYDADTLPEESVEAVRAMFTTGDHRMRLWAGVADDGKVVAHLYATLEPFGAETSRYVLIRQAEIDRGVDGGDASRRAFSDVVEWARASGVKRMLALTHRNVEPMYRRWGFEPYKMMLVKDL